MGYLKPIFVVVFLATAAVLSPLQAGTVGERFEVIIKELDAAKAAYEKARTSGHFESAEVAYNVRTQLHHADVLLKEAQWDIWHFKPSHATARMDAAGPLIDNVMSASTAAE